MKQCDEDYDGSAPGLRGFRRSLRRLEREIELALLAQTECCGVSLAQCHLLLEVADWKEGSIGDFAAALELDPSSLSRTADSLVKTGLLSREDDPANRRRLILRLSPEGSAKVAEIDRLCDGFYAGILGAVAEADRERVLAAVPVLAEAMGRARREGVSPCCKAGQQGSMDSKGGIA